MHQIDTHGAESVKIISCCIKFYMLLSSIYLLSINGNLTQITAENLKKTYIHSRLNKSAHRNSLSQHSYAEVIM